MKRTFKIAAIVMALGTATAAYAAIDTTAVVNELQAKGYTNIEVNTRGGQVEVEAIGGGQKLTLTYDAITGALLRQETSSVEHRNGIGAVTGSGVTGTSSSVSGDDDGLDDDGTDDDGTDDDGTDDDNGTDDENDDDSGDDSGDDENDDDSGDDENDDENDDDNGTDDENDD